MIRYYNLLLIASLGLKSVALVPLLNESANQTGHSGFAETDDIPEFLVKMYHANAKDDGTLKGNSKRLPPTVYGFIGQDTPEHNAVFFNLSVPDIEENKEHILSAKIRVMVNATDPQPPLPWYGRLVLYDKFSHKPIHSKAFQEGSARWFVFPARSLVRRWIFSPHANHGIYFRLKSHDPDVNVSLPVMADLKAPRKNRPLLIVQTHSNKAQGIKGMPSWMSLSKTPKLTHKSRSPRAVIHDEGACAIRPMRVYVRRHLNLREVLFPRYFDSNRCGGECKFPLDEKVNPSGHAVIRAILHSTQQDWDAGEPCCVPIKLRGVSLFVEETTGPITIKSYQEMIVEKCGCR